jgi:hypothetical protein
MTSQDEIYLPLKFISDVSGLTDGDLVTSLSADLTGNPYSNGFIGILIKYRNPEFDTSTYQSDMDIVINHCIEFLLLRFNRQLDSTVSLVRFIIKVLELSNLKYLYTVIAFLVRENVISKNGDLNWEGNSTYLTSFDSDIPSESIILDSNLIPVIREIVYVNDNRIVRLVIKLTNSGSSDIIVDTSLSGSFILFPDQEFTVLQNEEELIIDTECNINTSYKIANLNDFQYTSQILSNLQ